MQSTASDVTVGDDRRSPQTATIQILLSELMSGPRIDPRLRNALESAKQLIAEEREGGVFLSVLLRTKGKRPEPLRDALLCLAAQSDQDFEVIVIDHDATPADAAEVRAIVAQQSTGFLDRISLIEVHGGNRGKPLNAGIRAAHGRFVAVYDDDDLLFGNWVEEFKIASLTSEGRLLRSLVATQMVKPELWPQDQIGFRTLSWPKAEYPREFDQLAHLQMNYSPFMSWAFPAALFSILGFEFDEELTVCEDWDMILRGSLLLGVTEVDSLTAIYRRWEGGNSSYTDHSKKSWAWSEAKVLHRLESSLLIMPGDIVPYLRKSFALLGVHEQLAGLLHSRAWRYGRPIRGALRVAGFVKRRVNGLRGAIEPSRAHEPADFAPLIHPVSDESLQAVVDVLDDVNGANDATGRTAG
ncbi:MULTISPECIES: glycosyltransferase family A protein [Cryobacterium]|uniref:Glycosyltransferase family 2 protein n=1 Tax=Cryobacterium glucosi TaxID=1259175 RepID=A0ABY2IKS0_9MICO|nr:MULTISPECIES: glycosyltransferase family A protein [Cryobacterium]TFB98000.1 glycosyltransferase family 2 protein [Cryobacterium sp. MDB2-A-1]TFC10934.1 glycosyltransferase family 2 protein [Cryobacterium sp. MDB2-A-2]TFC14411.1 glycosyltransferase family 2 protein [Cryobacterium sp. MDB2-10]TFC19375.1 glycosyltransferase family 2 protein [Cryobacterium glucosi]